MDFRQATQPGLNRPAPVNPAPVVSELKSGKDNNPKERRKISKWTRVPVAVLLIGIAILLAGLSFALARGGVSEARIVKDADYQAVFLNNGQVYFGNITDLNNSYLRLTDVYYLTQSTTSTSTDTTSSSDSYSLVKLGCQQIHDPLDEMVINRSQVTFWENLSDSGKVVTSIKTFQKENPNGPDCSEVSTQTQASDTTTQATGTSSTSSTSTSSTGTSSK